MNEENVKLAKIKKSCGIGKKVAVILCIIAIVGSVCAAIAGIALLSKPETFEPEFVKAVESGVITAGESRVGSSKMFNIDLGDPTKWHSDVPSIQKAFDDHPYSMVYGLNCLIIALGTAVVAVMMKLVSSVFDLIVREDSPFCDKVIKRVTILLAVTSGLLLMTSGAALGILAALITWAVYTIMDYGKTLQIQSDETL